MCILSKSGITFFHLKAWSSCLVTFFMCHAEGKLCVKFLISMVMWERIHLFCYDLSPILCYVLSKLNSLSPKTLACNLKHQITITLARAHVKALLRVEFLVLARSQTLIPSSTPLCLLTAAICSSIDSFLEKLSITFDLTCTKKLVSFWLKALKVLLCFYLIYPSFYLMLALIIGF